ncbi:DNA-binding SARP family transcriptional activator [Paucibacter oligotrophus]|uniref:DNA-binding SARP family transcriptional activator n=1 Tax=Roseateles oligotrophus TaxID=1769250 RepID=A0A840L8Y0_9BURK|nr:AAA family ATPase [Roseateles oligotrophus]MBB4844536.1 DNA-binding SARP family transcriptional activator [Roseateles oligotrophus]
MPDAPACAEPAVRLHLCGAPRLAVANAMPQALGPRIAVLLALLALEGTQTRGQAAALLYPAQDEAAARRNLRQLLWAQRALLAPLLQSNGPDDLALHAAVWVDVLHGPAPAPLLGTQRFDKQPALQQWLQLQRQQLGQQQAETLAQTASLAEREGHLAQALQLAQRLLALQPGSEHAHRRLMRLHYLRGDRAAALAAFDDCERLLKDELSVRPGAETLALLHQIEQQTEPLPPGPRPVPASVLRPPRLIGRDAEWARLLQAWDQGEALLLLGEAGLGKSRLLADLALVREGCLPLAARAGDEQLPYALLSRLLRALLARRPEPPPPALRHELARLLPELGEARPLANEAQRARFLNAVLALIEQSRDTGLSALLLDDLHHADAASLAALPVLAQSAGLRWLAAARPAELAPATLALLQELGGTLAQMPLAPLSLAQVAELLASLGLAEPGAIDAQALYRHSGGNPLFVLESVKAWLSQPGLALAAPPRIGELIMRRIGRLSAPAVQLTRCAAIAGQDFSAELAAEVLGLRLLELAEPWAELEAAQLLREGGFAHDLIFEAARASVPLPVARALHGQVAAFLERQGRTPAVRLAGHWRAAQDWPRAAAAYSQAAVQARQTLRRLEEGQLLRQAAECARAAGDGQAQFEAGLALAQAALCESLGPQVLELAQQALQLARDDGQQLRALAVLAHALAQRVDDFGPRRAACEQGIALAQREGRPELALGLALPLAEGLLNAREIGAALALLEPLRDWAQQAAPPTLLCAYYNSLGLALDYGNRLVEAAQVHERQCELARTQGLHEATATALFSLGQTQAKRGWLRRAAESMDRGLQLMRSQQALAGLLLHRQATLGWRRRDLGEYRAALALMEDALAGMADVGPDAAAAFSVSHRLALAYAQLGQHGRARQLLQRHEPPPVGLPARRGLWLSHSAELARLAGELALARRQADEALALLAPQREDIPYRVVCLQACPLLPAEAGEAMASGLAAWAAAHERFGLALAAHVRGADCAVRAGQPARALGHVEAARSLAQQFDTEIIYKGEYWLACAQALALSGQAEAARALHNDGRAWLAHCAAEQVPEAFLDSFVQRNPVNRALRRESR